MVCRSCRPYVICGAAQVTKAEQDVLPSQWPSAPQPAATQQAAWSAAPALPPVCSVPALVIKGVSWQRYSLPLQRPLTTGAQTGRRNGFLLTMRTEPVDGGDQAHVTADHAPATGASTSAARDGVTGVGEVYGISWRPDAQHMPNCIDCAITPMIELLFRLGMLASWSEQVREGWGRTMRSELQVAPLLGLHRESMADAEAQLALLCRLLPGVAVPPTLALLEVDPQR